MNTILFCILMAIGFAAFVFLGWSFCNWIDGYKDAGVRMSFGEFRRIYELAPSKWEGRGIIVIVGESGFMMIKEALVELISLRVLR